MNGSAKLASMTGFVNIPALPDASADDDPAGVEGLEPAGTAPVETASLDPAVDALAEAPPAGS